jgi:hypothetical protein
MKRTAISDVTPCSAVEDHRYFEYKSKLRKEATKNRHQADSGFGT